MGKSTASKRAERVATEVHATLVSNNASKALEKADDSDIFFTDFGVSGSKRARSEYNGAKVYVRAAKAPRPVSKQEQRIIDDRIAKGLIGEEGKGEERRGLPLSKAIEIANNPLDARATALRKHYIAPTMDIWAANDMPTAKRARLQGKPAVRNSLADVGEGFSYHPSLEAHQEGLRRAVQKEEAELAKAAALEAAISFGKPVAIPHITDIADLSSDEEEDGNAGANDAADGADGTEAGAVDGVKTKKRKQAKSVRRRAAAEKALRESEAGAREIEAAAAAAEAAVLAITEKSKKPADRAAPKPKINRGASGRDALMLPLSDELHGSMRLIRPVSTGIVAVDSLRKLVDRGAVAPKRKVVHGKDSGKKRYKMVEFPRKAYTTGDGEEE